MANHMSAREAWEIVKGGNPMHRRYPEEWEVMRYARACAIVEALVHAHTGLNEMSDYDVPIRTVKVRALERGDEIPKVNVRARERGRRRRQVSEPIERCMCGGVGAVAAIDGYTRIECRTCGLVGLWRANEQSARSAWKARSFDPSVCAEVLSALFARVSDLEREVELLRDTASTEARLACAWARKLPDDHWMIRDGIVIGLRSLIALAPRAEVKP